MKNNGFYTTIPHLILLSWPLHTNSAISYLAYEYISVFLSSRHLFNHVHAKKSDMSTKTREKKRKGEKDDSHFSLFGRFIHTISFYPHPSNIFFGKHGRYKMLTVVTIKTNVVIMAFYHIPSLIQLVSILFLYSRKKEEAKI